jgi:hypothetical protein
MSSFSTMGSAMEAATTKAPTKVDANPIQRTTGVP